MNLIGRFLAPLVLCLGMGACATSRWVELHPVPSISRDLPLLDGFEVLPPPDDPRWPQEDAVVKAWLRAAPPSQPADGLNAIRDWMARRDAFVARANEMAPGDSIWSVALHHQANIGRAYSEDCDTAKAKTPPDSASCVDPLTARRAGVDALVAAREPLPVELMDLVALWAVEANLQSDHYRQLSPRFGAPPLDAFAPAWVEGASTIEVEALYRASTDADGRVSGILAGALARRALLEGQRTLAERIVASWDEAMKVDGCSEPPSDTGSVCSRERAIWRTMAAALAYSANTRSGIPTVDAQSELMRCTASLGEEGLPRHKTEWTVRPLDRKISRCASRAGVDDRILRNLRYVHSDALDPALP